MIERLVVCIGTATTGGRALHKVLHDSRELLRAQGVVALPADSGISDVADGLAQARQAGARTLLLVNDRLARPGQAQRLAAEASGVPIEALCFMRRQDRLVEALLQQRLTQPGSGAAAGVVQVADFWRAAEQAEQLDYHAVLTEWAAVCRSLQARVFVDVSEEAGPVGTLARHLGVALPLPQRPKRATAGVGAPDKNLALALTRLEQLPFSWNRKRVVHASSLLDPNLYRPANNVLGVRQRLELLESVKDSNARLEADFKLSFDTRMPREPQEPVEDADTLYLISLLARLSLPLPTTPAAAAAAALPASPTPAVSAA